MSDKYKVFEAGPLTAWGNAQGWQEGQAGRKFLDGEIDLQNFGVSVNAILPGKGCGYWHSHTRMEELYLFVEGEGEMALDDKVIRIKPGTAVRVGTNVMRSWRALPTSPTSLKWICVRGGDVPLSQVGADAYPITDKPYPWDKA